METNISRTAHNLDSSKWRSLDIKIDEDINFSGLLLSDKVLTGLEVSGFVRPSPIQLRAIPLGRSGLDLVVQAKSGTGKTCVFVVIALEKILLECKATQVLVLAPTREVAVQICQVVRNIGASFKGLQCHTFIGGMPLQDDKIRLRKCHIAVGTPGRIKQLIKQDLLKINSIRLFVLDEADKLMEENFQECINWIYSSLPVRKQMLALSATYPEELAQLLQMYMTNPAVVRLNAEKPALLGIAQLYISTPYHPVQHVCFQSKIEALVKILNKVSFSQCLIFSNYQTRAESLCDILKKRGWPTEYISGGQEQNRRLHAIDRLKKFKCRVLVSTDVTSRGIDAENVNLVINMDIPWELETYLHRIGRAGRFGTQGLAISLVSGEEESKLFEEIRVKGGLQISVLPDPMPTDLWTYASENNKESDQNEVKENGDSKETSDLPVNESHKVELQINSEPCIVPDQEKSITNVDEPLVTESDKSECTLTQSESCETTEDIINCPPPDLPTKDLNSILSYDELMLDFGKSLQLGENTENSMELTTECDEETQALLTLSSFLVSSHEEFRLKLEDGFTKSDNSDVKDLNENLNVVEGTEKSDNICPSEGIPVVNNICIDSVRPSLHLPSSCLTMQATEEVNLDDVKSNCVQKNTQTIPGLVDGLSICAFVSNDKTSSCEHLHVENHDQIIALSAEASSSDSSSREDESTSEENETAKSKKIVPGIDYKLDSASRDQICNETIEPVNIQDVEKSIKKADYNSVSTSQENLNTLTKDNVQHNGNVLDNNDKLKKLSSKIKHLQTTNTSTDKECTVNKRISKVTSNESGSSSRNRDSTSCSDEIPQSSSNPNHARNFHLPSYSAFPPYNACSWPCTNCRASLYSNASSQAYLNDWWSPNTRMATVYLEYQRYMSHLLSRNS